MSELTGFLTPHNVTLISKEIVDTLVSDATKENVSHDYRLSRGEMASKNPNTFFQFDPKEGSVINNFKKLLFSEDFDDEPGVKLTKEQINTKSLVDAFHNDVYLEVTGSYGNILREIFHKTVIPDADIRIFPLKDIELVDVEILDLSSMDEQGKYQLVIEKKSPKNIASTPVASILSKIHSETGLPYNDIIEQKKKENNPDFKYVTGATLKKIYFECSLSFYVNYAPIPQDQFLKLQEEDLKRKQGT